MSTQVCAVVSGKGGVGRSVSTFFMANILAGEKKRAIVLDFNMGVRGMDMIFREEENIVYDLADVLGGKCDSYHSAVFSYKNNPNLKGIAAPSNPFYYFTFDELYALMTELRRDFNYIFLDAPAAICAGFVSAVALCDRAIILTTPDPLSVTGAMKIGHYITNSDTDNAHILINGVNFRSKRAPIISNFDSIIDRVGYPLLGIIPFEEKLYDMIMKRKNLDPNMPYFKAMYNIAKRYNGNKLPIKYG